MRGTRLILKGEGFVRLQQRGLVSEELESKEDKYRHRCKYKIKQDNGKTLFSCGKVQVVLIWTDHVCKESRRKIVLTDSRGQNSKGFGYSKESLTITYVMLS